MLYKAAGPFVVVDFENYTGPRFFGGDEKKDRKLFPVPFVEVHGIAGTWREGPAVTGGNSFCIHKSQSLSLEQVVVVEISERNAASLGLAFVAFTRSKSWDRQFFNRLPPLESFIKVRTTQAFEWRRVIEEELDALHEESVDTVAEQAEWATWFDNHSKYGKEDADKRKARAAAALAALKHRGVLPADPGTLEYLRKQYGAKPGAELKEIFARVDANRARISRKVVNMGAGGPVAGPKA